MVDHQLWNSQSPNRLGQRTESLDVTDVEHDEQVNIAQTSGSLRRFLIDVPAEKKSKALRPGSRIHDPRLHSEPRKKSGEGGLRPAAVTIGVDVGRYCDRAPRAKLPRETLDRFRSGLTYR